MLRLSCCPHFVSEQRRDHHIKQAHCGTLFFKTTTLIRDDPSPLVNIGVSSTLRGHRSGFPYSHPLPSNPKCSSIVSLPSQPPHPRHTKWRHLCPHTKHATGGTAALGGNSWQERPWTCLEGPANGLSTGWAEVEEGKPRCLTRNR